jgi:3-methyladenine DNA glycosylase AlkD
MPAADRDRLESVLAALERVSTKKDRDNLARFGITAGKAYGVSMANIQRIAKAVGRNHALAGDLWKTGWYEARLLTSFVDEPDRVTPAQMDRWCRDFDNWGICDTVCFHLFDRTPHAWAKVEQWHDQPGEFVKRAAFALLASLALHDKSSGNESFSRGLVLVERAATDERNFVKKGVSWALRLIGRRNSALHAKALASAKRLSSSSDRTARWIGNGAVRELTSAVVMKKVGQAKGSAVHSLAPRSRRNATV